MSLLKAAKLASSGQIVELEQVIFSDKEYFLCSDHYSPHSAWTILLVCLPETVSVQQYKDLLNRLYRESRALLSSSSQSNDNNNGNAATSNSDSSTQYLESYLHTSATAKMWNLASINSTNNDSLDAIYSQWLRLRIQIVDDFCGPQQDDEWIYILIDGAPEAAQAWYRGIASPVMQCRRQAQFPSVSWISIRQFENEPDPLNNVSFLMKNGSSQFHLVSQYLEYINDWTPAYQWIKDRSSDLGTLESIAGKSPFISRPILAACLVNAHPDWALVRNILSKVGKLEDDGRADEEFDLNETQDFNHDDSAVSANETYEKKLIAALQSKDAFDELAAIVSLSPPHLVFLSQIVTVSAALDCPLSATILVTQNSEQTAKFVKSYATSDKINWTDFEIHRSVLKSVFPLLDMSWLESIILRHMLATGHFDAVKSHFADHAALEDLALSQFKVSFELASNPSPRNIHLIHAGSCIDVCNNPIAPQVVRARALLTATTELSRNNVMVRPGDLTVMPTMDIIRLCLTSNSSLYQDVDEVTAIAHMLNESKHVSENDLDNQVRFACVEAALNRHPRPDFDLAYKYCISDDVAEDNSQWECQFAVGNYSSAQAGYSLERQVDVLNKQLNALARALQHCPQPRIIEVLSVWKCREMELNDLQESQVRRITPSPQPESHNQQQRLSNYSHQQQQRKRDQLSNMLKSGIGWVVGATEEDMR